VKLHNRPATGQGALSVCDTPNGSSKAPQSDPKRAWARLRNIVYFSRSHTSLRKSVVPGANMLGAGAVSMKSVSPSIL
jgi:hypothetical protein